MRIFKFIVLFVTHDLKVHFYDKKTCLNKMSLRLNLKPYYLKYLQLSIILRNGCKL